jgi:kinesin family protein 4/21/27
VINILSENANPKLKKEEKVYVPYRDSKLTSILKQSIGGNSYCLMIACINPNDSFLEENLSTLTYATKASFITNRPVVNDDPRIKATQELKRQVKQLSEELDKANKHIEFLSTLQDKIPSNSAPQPPKKAESPSKIKRIE